MSLFAPGARSWWLAFCLCLLAARPALGQREMAADLTVDLDAQGKAELWLNISALHEEGGPPIWKTKPDGAAIARAVEQSIGGTLHGQETGYDEADGWILQGWSTDAFVRHLLRVQGQLAPAPLIAALRPYHVTSVYIRVTHPNLPGVAIQAQPGVAQHLQPGQAVEPVVIETTLQLPLATAPKVIPIDYGYRTESLLGILTPPGIVLLLPLLVIGWLRQRALQADRADPTAVWFAYMRWAMYVQTGFWVLWLCLAFGLGLPSLCAFAVASSHQVGTLCSMGLLLGLPTLIFSLCAGMGQPVYARVRGLERTRADLMLEMGLANLATFLPIILAVAALGALWDNQARMIVVWLAAAFFGRRLILKQLIRVRQMSPQAITSGELRDRIFALAERAGVKLGQVYLLPAGKARMANAFAVAGNNVLLTDYLLAQLSKREIDAVMAHELGHLRHRHPVRLVRTLAGVTALVVAGWIGLYHFFPAFQTLLSVVAPMLIVASTSVYYLQSRRFERVADSEAVTLTADAPAMITALVKIGRLNMLPMSWGRNEALLTHPSTLRRAEVMAKQAGISPERLADIIAAPDADAERYLLPSAGTADQGPLFTTNVKYRWSQSVAWVSLWITILTPALFALIDRLWPVPVAISWAYWPAGIVVTLAVMLAAEDRGSMRGFAQLERQLTQRLAREGIPPPGTEGYFVLFAPDPTPRLYEGFGNWDIGMLVLAGDRLCYVGEQTRFAVPRAQVIDAWLGPGGAGVTSYPALYITWRDPSQEIDTTFHIRAGAANSLRRMARDTAALAGRVAAWRQEPLRSAELPPTLAALGYPERQTVTSISPRAYARLPVLLNGLLFKLLLAVGVCILLQLSLRLNPPASGWYVLTVAAGATIIQFAKMARYRERNR